MNARRPARARHGSRIREAVFPVNEPDESRRAPIGPDLARQSQCGVGASTDADEDNGRSVFPDVPQRAVDGVEGLNGVGAAKGVDHPKPAVGLGLNHDNGPLHVDSRSRWTTRSPSIGCPVNRSNERAPWWPSMPKPS